MSLRPRFELQGRRLHLVNSLACRTLRPAVIVAEIAGGGDRPGGRKVKREGAKSRGAPARRECHLAINNVTQGGERLRDVSEARQVRELQRLLETDVPGGGDCGRRRRAALASEHERTLQRYGAVYEEHFQRHYDQLAEAASRCLNLTDE